MYTVVDLLAVLGGDELGEYRCDGGGFGGSADSKRGRLNKERTAISNRLFMGAFLVESLFVVLQPVGDESLLRRRAGHNCLSDYWHGVQCSPIPLPGIDYE